MTRIHPARVLVVDDHGEVRALVSRILQDAGYEVVAVTDGEAAYTAALDAAEPYHLVVTNNHMPGMSGVELVKRLRERYPRLPVLHLDDHSQPDQGRMPADVLELSKPFSVEALATGVQQLLAGREM
jgi:CheY-like chemotaxis protein